MKKLVDVNVKRQLTARQQRQLHIKELFAIIAPEYDFISRALSLGRDPAWKRAALRLLPDVEKPVCLDIACGTGDLAFGLAEKYKDGQVYGFDVTPEMINIAQCRNTYKHVTFTVQDMHQTSFEDNSVDIITAGYSLFGVQHLPGYLQELMRLLKPGGVVVMLDQIKPVNSLGFAVSYCFLKTWGNLWSLLLHGMPSIYTYAVDSHEEIYTAQALHQHILDAGFIKLATRRYGLGLVEVLTFEKRR